jgi:putative ABC transport system permease protein
MLDTVYFEKIKSSITEALRVVKTNTVRTFLTALGIIFGVAAVITMLAIGKGAEKEILSQLERIGVNNIIITPKTPRQSTGNNKTADKKKASFSKKYAKGLDISDAESIAKHIPSIALVSPEVILTASVINNGRQKQVKLVGVTPDFFTTANVKIAQGKLFSNHQIRNAAPVCIIGRSIEKKLFAGQRAIGKFIKVKHVWLQVTGIIEEQFVSSKAQENLGIRDLNQDIYIPIKTFLIRFEDRKKDEQTLSKTPVKLKNNNQIDKLTVQVKKANTLQSTAEVISKMLKRRHNGKLNFEITIPIQLLKQQQKTKQIFNIVLSIIAGISLLIGGIGIMNIMLASVLERTKEIGIMRAIGATREDVVLQFLAESVLISVGGGIIGIVLGIIGAYSIEITSGIETVLSLNSILLSFAIAVGVGLVFGILPAKSAANKKPIEALRSE